MSNTRKSPIGFEATLTFEEGNIVENEPTNQVINSSSDDKPDADLQPLTQSFLDKELESLTLGKTEESKEESAELSSELELPPAAATSAALFWIQAVIIGERIDAIRSVAIAGGDWNKLFDRDVKDSYNGVKLGISLAIIQMTENPGFRLANWEYVTNKILEYARKRRSEIVNELDQLKVTKNDLPDEQSNVESNRMVVSVAPSISVESVGLFQSSDQSPKEKIEPTVTNGPNLS